MKIQAVDIERLIVTQLESMTKKDMSKIVYSSLLDRYLKYENLFYYDWDTFIGEKQ